MIFLEKNPDPCQIGEEWETSCFENGDDCRTEQVFLSLPRCWPVCRVKLNLTYLAEKGQIVTGDRYTDNLIDLYTSLFPLILTQNQQILHRM